MAQNENILTRLGKLFSSNIIVRKTDSGQLVVKDINMSQTGLTSNFVDRYNRLMHGASWAQKYSAKQNRSAYDIARKELFRDYELMDSDPIIASSLDIYSDESTVDNIEGEILSIKTEESAVGSLNG